ncbi:hypothetical protein WH47_02426 [Habropoda laboriosa]|uniref:Uncharacterized protein n=1 Tax=Habropoda laboriosa TaxID=597456 RepID=A0A0L7QWI7_9HYME|nr:hypothetical protein WH47_02426 [Habropoda laboriosa]
MCNISTKAVTYLTADHQNKIDILKVIAHLTSQYQNSIFQLSTHRYEPTLLIFIHHRAARIRAKNFAVVEVIRRNVDAVRLWTGERI